MTEDGLPRSELVKACRDAWEIVKEASHDNYGRGQFIPERVQGQLAGSVLHVLLSYDIEDDQV
jgi:hypothetical protein